MIDDGIEKDALRRLARIEGQVKGVARMVKERRYCVDIATQIAAVEAALHRVSEIVLRRHLETCVSDAFRSGDRDDQRRKVDELMGLYARFRAR